MTLMWIIALVFLVPGYVASLIFLSGKGGGMIVGFSGLSPEEREKVDEAGLCRYVGWLLLVFVLLLTGAFVASLYRNMLGAWVIIALACLELVAGVLYLNKSGRFRKN